MVGTRDRRTAIPCSPLANRYLLLATLPMIRLLVDPPATGVWNMSVDEALMLSAAGNDPLMTLRFYRWSEPTLSLGYFQHVSDRFRHDGSVACDLVRRSTGGGAIVHAHDLTYSLTSPVKSRFVAHSQQLYRVIHQSLIESLAKRNVHCRMHEDSDNDSTPGEPFLCFQRRAGGDVLWNDSKVAGSAQRRRRGSVLQHGSVLLSTSPLAPELPGILQLTGINLSAEDLVDSWTFAIQRTLGTRPQKGVLRDEEIGWAKSFARDKFGNDQWTNRR